MNRVRCALLVVLLCLQWIVGTGVVAAGGGYPVVRDDVALVFPDDTGAHPEYRTEWWYVTGWLTDDAGVQRGFQLTFFRVRTLIGEDNPSLFAPSQLLLAHAAVADPAHGRLLHAERAERALPGLAGAASGRTDVFVGDWFLRLEDEEGESADGTASYRSQIATERFAFSLNFRTPHAPVLNGRQGFSQKTGNPLNASYYYSRPQLKVSGELTVDGRARPVTGHAWLDHEWSSEILPEEAGGWDWLGINLHDGGSLMAFQMRDRQGQALWTAATLRESGGRERVLAPHEVSFEPLRLWQSARTGARYPVAWRVRVAEHTYLVEPLMDDQELDSRRSTGAVYWEGAVRLRAADGTAGSAELGQGYLEMTGYLDRLRM